MYDYLLDKLVNDKVIVPLLILLFFFPFVLSCSGEQAGTSVQKVGSVRELTSAPTRLVWVQDLHKNRDVFTRGKALRLMGYDSEDGKKERIILPGPENFVRPLISPSGNQIVFSNSHRQMVEVVDWSGKNRRSLTKGVAVAVGRKGGSGPEWAYVARSPVRGYKSPTYQKLYRVQLNNPRVEQLVWDKSLFTGVLQLSGKGTHFVSETPWPKCSLVDLGKGKSHRYAKGCWPAMAPDQSMRVWYLEGDHKNLNLVDSETGKEHVISLANMPGIGGYEVYHPRWASHSRYLVVSGPYTIREGLNRIRGGGAGVEIYAGRFNRDYTAVEAWVRVSHNQRADFYPDMWVEQD